MRSYISLYDLSFIYIYMYGCQMRRHMLQFEPLL